MKNSKHILTIVGLLLLFLVVIFFSTSKVGIQTDYTFNDIEVTESNDYNTEVLLGKVTVKNDGILPKRVELDRLVLCNYYNRDIPRSYYVNYRGKNVDTYKDGYSGMYSYSNMKYVEISSNEEVELNMVPSFSKYDFYGKTPTSNYQGKTIPFYLFKMRADDNRYDFCSGVNKEDAYKIINVKFN